MSADSDPPRSERRTPARGVHATRQGATIVWGTVCAAERGTSWCAQAAVREGLEAVWRHEALAWRVGDYLLMPDHLHFFATPAPDGPAVSIERWTAFWKDRLAKRWQQPAWRWQRGVFHHRLRTERAYVDKGVYMARNPVRAGCVDTPEAWPWKGRIHTIRW